MYFSKFYTTELTDQFTTSVPVALKVAYKACHLDVKSVVGQSIQFAKAMIIIPCKGNRVLQNG